MSTEVLPITLANSSGSMGVTATASSGLIPGGEGDQIRIYNAGPNLVAVTTSNGVGITTSIPIFPVAGASPSPVNGVGSVIAVGATEVFSIKSCDTINAICPTAGTAVLYYSRGKGN